MNNSSTNFGFVRIASAVPEVKVADCEYNIAHIEELIDEAVAHHASAILFPELCITAYTCADLFRSQFLIQKALDALNDVVCYSEELNIVIIVGLPLQVSNSLYNCAAVIYRGGILGIVPKTYLPNYNEFYEYRWFASALDCTSTTISLFGQTDIPFGQNIIFRTADYTFGIELCEDLWTPIPPSSVLSLQGAQVIFNLSASNELSGKNSYLRQLICQQSARTISGYVYSSAGLGESSTDLIYSGNALIAEKGGLIAQNTRFERHSQIVYGEIDIESIRFDRQNNTTFGRNLHSTNSAVNARFVDFKQSLLFTPERYISPTPFIPSKDQMDEKCKEIFNIQVAGLATRLHHTGIKRMVIGISGGLDSTLALLACARTADRLGIERSNIIGVTMPGFGTTGRTYRNAVDMIEKTGATLREISIKDACMQHFKDLNHNPEQHDVTYENSQARERTQLLMDLANQYSGLVVGTGDLSELALGWATYNGDHMSMYAVNVGIPKTLIQYIIRYAADHEFDASLRDCLLDVINTPISPELLPAKPDDTIAQKTEDLVGPYELHDFYLYYTLRYGFSPEKIHHLATRAFNGTYSNETITHWLSTFCRRFFNQQFKRSCLPDGPKVMSVSLSPRGDWRMPSDASSRAWLDDIKK